MDPNCVAKEILESFSPFDQRKSFGDIGNLWIIIIFAILQGLPLDLEVLGDMHSLHVCHHQISSYHVVVLDDIAGNHNPTFVIWLQR